MDGVAAAATVDETGIKEQDEFRCERDEEEQHEENAQTEEEED